MNKDITVYWAIPHGQGYVPYFLNIENPSPLIIELKKLGQYLGDNQENAYSGSILKCPSVIDITKNNFVITSPMDIDITWQNGKISVPKEMSSYVQIRDDNSGFLSLTFIKYIFFTEEENLTMRVRNAFFTNNDFTKKCNIIEGEFNIGQWFRAIDLAFYFKEPGTVSIKKGDPLLYIEFQAKENIKMKKYMFTTELSQINQYCLQAKNYNKFPIANYFNLLYTMFNKSKVKTQILKHIKNNLVD
jgi:hypothetical protein